MKSSLLNIRKCFSFESAHVLPHHVGKCSRLHGHSYRLEVVIKGPVQQLGSSAGMVMDFAEISAIIKAEIISVLDHQYLNDLIDNPTCERLVLWIIDKVQDHLPGLSEVTLWETATASATWLLI